MPLPPVSICCGLVCAALVLPASLCAQVVRGTVVDATDRAVSGVVVALVDSAQSVVARALTNERGEYRVAATRAGRYRVRTLRIGFQPTESRALQLAMGEVVNERLVLDGVRVALDAMRIVARSACGRQSSADAGMIFSAWDQAMTSIASTALTSSGRGLTATTMLIDRTLDGAGKRVLDQTASVRTDYVTQPWRSLPPDSLRKHGYTTLDKSDWTTYNAPGLDVLVSAAFLEDHCIRVVAGADTGEIGVAFEPTLARRNRSEIRGTLWLERASANLRRLEFVFTGGPTATTAYSAGGSMTFTRVPDGAVVITSWEIRMPELVKDSPRDTKVRVARVVATGGQLVVLRRAADTLFKRAALAVSGTVLDSASGRPIPSAHVAILGTTWSARSDSDGKFAIPDVLPGEYTLAVRTPSLDSVRAASQSTLLVTEGMTPQRLRVPTGMQLASALCGPSLSGSSGRGKGAVLGTVRMNGDTSGVSGVRVVADWTNIVTRGGANVDRQGKRMETKSDASGAYRLCGVPTETLLSLRALPERGRATPITVRLNADERFVARTLSVDGAQSAVASFVGVVVADSSQRVLADAEVAIPSLSLSTRSNARGEFRLPEVPAGTHEIFVRRVGFGAMSTPMTFAANEEEERRIVLRQLTVLDSIEVTASRSDPGMSEFEENRKLGLGRFVTREDLERQRGRRMGDVLATVSGLGVVQGRSGAWVLSKRYVVGLSGDQSPSLYKPSKFEKLQGIVTACYAQVWVDNQLMNPTHPTEPFDLNQYTPDQIEGIEIYAGSAQTPPKFAKLNSNCGVVVVRLRRDPPP